MAKLDIIIGPMFGGKSTELIRRIRKLDVLNKQYASIKPTVDNRYSYNKIVSHNNDKINCNCYNLINDFIKNTELKNMDTIFIEEGQFFNDLKEGVIKLVEHFNCNVVIVGLDGDSNRNKFGQILDLIPYSDTCIKITALCKICNDGTPAIFSHRKNKNKNQVEVGAYMYESLCRKHYLELN